MLAMAALKLAKLALPIIQEAAKKGLVPVEKQKEVFADYNALVDAGDTAFSGPEWDIDPD